MSSRAKHSATPIRFSVKARPTIRTRTPSGGSIFSARSCTSCNLSTEDEEGALAADDGERACPHRCRAPAAGDRRGPLRPRHRRAATSTFYAALESDKPENRSNDGRTHPSGALWIGTMSKRARNPRRRDLSRRRRRVTKIFDGISIPNSICFSPDGTIGIFHRHPPQPPDAGDGRCADRSAHR